MDKPTDIEQAAIFKIWSRYGCFEIGPSELIM